MKTYQNLFCLIDDDEVYRYTLKRMLSKLAPDMEVMEFRHGEVALQYFNHPQKLGFRMPAYIFLDINMPVMDGWEFLKAYSNLPDLDPETFALYMVSSSMDIDDLERARSNKFVQEYLVKPVSRDMLQRVLNLENVNA